MAINWNFELTNVALLIGALVAALYARRQVAEMRVSNRKLAESGISQEYQLRASVLLTLDQRWESPQMAVARASLHKLREEVEAESNERSAAQAYNEKLASLRSSNPALYLRVFQICGFFETVGYVACANYISRQEIIDLLGPSILEAGRIFLPHIQALRDLEGNDSHLFDYFLWLLDRARREEARRPKDVMITRL